MKKRFLLMLSLNVLIVLGGFSQQNGDNSNYKISPPLSEKVEKRVHAKRQVLASREDDINKIRSERAKATAKILADTLKLNPSEQLEVERINWSLEQQKAQVFRNDTTRSGRTIKIREIEESRENLYRAALTKEQFERYLMYKRNRMATRVVKSGG